MAADMNTNRHAWGSDVYHRPDPETDCPVVKIKPSNTTVSATETLREALKKHHLRLAQYPELQGQTYVLECRVCGEVTQLDHWQQIVGDCCICHIPWHKAAPTFYVLLPDSVPVPEE